MGASAPFGGTMKIKLLQPLNIDGKDFRAGDIIQVSGKAEDAYALIRGGYAVAVIERAVDTSTVEVRG